MSLTQIFNSLLNKPIAQSSNNTSFTRKKLLATVTLNQGSFAGGGNTIVIRDLAMNAKVEKAGPPEFGKASLEIWGLSLEHMEQLSTLNMIPLYTKRNYLNISAGDDKEGMTQIFAGSITSATADFNGAPDIKFKIDAQVGYFGSVTPQGQNFVSGSQPVANFISQQAQKAGMKFTNQGVSAQIKNSVFQGSPIEQARQAARQVGAELIIDDEQMILIPDGASVKGGTVPVLSSTTGLLGYPVMTQNGIDFKCVYNRDLRFAGLVELKTLVPKCSGQWRIIKLTHNLSSDNPASGAWESQATAYYPHLSGIVGKY